MCDDSPKTRQLNELGALEAIYGDQVQDLRKRPVWGQWSPLDVTVALRPQQGGSTGAQEVHAQVNLRVICDNDYPNSSPKIQVENAKGLSNDATAILESELVEILLNLKGEEVIYELCQHVEAFLHKHNKPNKSFYDQMQEHQKEKEEEQEKEQNRVRQSFLKEVQQRQEYRESEKRLRRETEGDEVLEEVQCKLHDKTEEILFENRLVHKGICLRHGSDCIHFVALDSATGEPFIVTRWTFHDKKEVSKQLGSIEQELKYLIELKHPNLATYHGIRQEHFNDKIVVEVLKQFVNGVNYKALLQGCQVDLSILKHLIKGLLLALEYLHRNNVLHRNLTSNSVFINDKGQVVLTNYSIPKRLSDFHNNSCLNNYTKEDDIFNVGLLILELLKRPCDNKLQVPLGLCPDLDDFIRKCTGKDNEDRWTAGQLLRHSFVNQSLVSSPKHQEMYETSSRIEGHSSVMTNDVLLLSNRPQNGQSRITNEFQFCQFLGRGAFGDVIKYQNKLDGRFYAIKRIKLNRKNKQLNKKIVREVKLLSQLNHENVVRYYNSWIEPKVLTSEEKSDQEEDESPSDLVAEPESSSDDSGAWNELEEESSSSDGIEFERSSNAKPRSEEAQVHTNHAQEIRQIDYMYIQMEFCEKSTLRTAIDDDLWLDEGRVSRLFREMVEGLAHIHQQAMIHRDLKPMNIFLDYNDHVKIGDFGLATKNIRAKSDFWTLNAEQDDLGDESKTGLVGTALYVAPEVDKAPKTSYNEKVDIYSLGVICFEMCYKPLKTAMERIEVLKNIRSKTIKFPEDFATTPQSAKQRKLITWLLDFDARKRPTSQELLQSEFIPPPVLEERKLRELVRHTLNNPQLKGYKYLIASCFEQKMSCVEDLTYDQDPPKNVQLYEFVRQEIIAIFKQHGGQNLATSLLVPNSAFSDNCVVKLMTHFGTIVTLPYNLRVPFARFIAWNDVTNLRRFNIERVFREKKVFGFQPRELFECAFDIVSPTPGASFLNDSEILYIIYEIVNRMPSLKNKNFRVKLNHTQLLKSILLYAGVKDNHEGIYKILNDIKEKKTTKSELYVKLSLPDSNIRLLSSFLFEEFELDKVTSSFQSIIKKQSETGRQAKEALNELKLIAKNAQTFGLNFPIVISPGLTYNVQQYSGTFFQIVCETKKKKHKLTNEEVLAAGGRYDSLISLYRNIMEQAKLTSINIKQSAVGVSISLDKLVQAIQKDKELNYFPKFDVEVALCCVGTKAMIKEKTEILKSLWSKQIRYYFFEVLSLKEMDEQLHELKLRYIIILMDKELGYGLVRSWTNNCYQEKKYSLADLLRLITEPHFLDNCTIPEQIVRCDSTTTVESNTKTIDILFVAQKILAPVRKRLENQIRSHLETIFKKLNGQIIVLGLHLDGELIRRIRLTLNFESEGFFKRTLNELMQQQKYDKCQEDIRIASQEMYKLKLKNSSCVIVLYSIHDSLYELLF